MGDRALIILHNTQEVSPTIYLHWKGEEVPQIIERLKVRMGTRVDDVNYAAARCVQEATMGNDGNLSFGLWNTPEEIQDAVLKNKPTPLIEYSHGDAGVIVVNCHDFSWKAYGGYLAA